MKILIEKAVVEQALGVLEKHVESFDYEHFTSVCELDPAKDTILTLREALAEQAEQEPVAWMDLHKELGKLRWMGGDEGWDNAINAVRDRLVELAIPVRTKDLTDEEITNEWESMGRGLGKYTEFARAVIAADREKNK